MGVRIRAVSLGPQAPFDCAILLSSNSTVSFSFGAKKMLKSTAYLLEKLSNKQIGDKLNELLLTDTPGTGLDFLKELGILGKILPELERCNSVKQNNKYHIDNVFVHSLKTCNLTPKVLTLRWAGLLHDLGKHQAYKEDERGEITFHKHEVFSTNIAKDVMQRFSIDPDVAAEVISLVSLHMYHYTGPTFAFVDDSGKEINNTRTHTVDGLLSNKNAFGEKVEIKVVENGWNKKTVRKFIEKMNITKDNVGNLSNIPLFELRRADRKSRGLEPTTEKQLDFEKRLRDHLEEE